MKFTFDETEMLNTLFENPKNVTKDNAIVKLEKTIPYTEEPEILKKLHTLIQKIKNLDVATFQKIFNDFPVDTFTEY